MEPLSIVAGLLTIIAPLIQFITRSSQRLPPGTKVLLVFATIVGLFGLIVLRTYWPQIMDPNNRDNVLFAVGLVLAMIAGMFVQVIASNYKAGKPLFDVTASQLIFPTLFSIIVFYSVWVTADATKTLFSIHAAFLNGYFWESVVSAMQPPPPPDPPKPRSV
jgi:hypothetical protein